MSTLALTGALIAINAFSGTAAVDSRRVIEVIADKDNTFKVVGQNKPVITLKPGEKIVLKITSYFGGEKGRDGSLHTLWNLRLYEQAVEEAKKVGDERVIALSRIEQGRLDEAVAADRGMKAARNPVILAQLAYVYARGGMKNKARTILSGLV